MQLRLSSTAGPCLLTAFIAFLSPLAAAGAQLFNEDFAGSLSARWTAVDQGRSLAPSQWRVKGGVLEQTTDIYGAAADPLVQPGTYLAAGDAGWSSYRISVRMQTVDDDDSIGVMFGYQSPGNYYRFSMDRQAARRRLVKLVNGVATQLAEDSVAYQKNVWYTVEARMTGGFVEILIDGTSIFRVNDVSHNSGKIALYSWWNKGARFDDVEVATDDGAESCSYSLAPGEVM